MSQKRRTLFHKVILCFLCVIFLLTAGSILYFRYIVEDVIREEENLTSYDKHIAMIVENREDIFWTTIYESARKAGEEQGYYIEMFGDNLSVDYSKQELLKIAIDASVDGIIIEGDDSEGLIQEIARAQENKIPVITVLSDSTTSARQCYVGINSYHLGQTFGKQVLQNIENGAKNVCILMNRNELDTSQNIIYSGINEEVRKGTKNPYKIYITAIQDNGTFGAEETVRDIFLKEEELPDVLICLDQISTTSACQAVVDFNQVGEVEIIGCYRSDTIISAIRKNVLQATVTFDTESMGAECVNALTEYWRSGHVSEFKPVSVSLVTAENVEEYIENETAIQ